MKVLILGLALVAACEPSEVQLRGGRYTTNLEECNRTANTLCESIDCENRYRRAEGRLPREIPQHCRDAGTPDGGSK